MAQLIRTSGVIGIVNPKNGIEFELEEMRQLIGGGWLDGVRFDDTSNMYVNDEGYWKQLPYNIVATRLLSQKRGRSVPIYGDALIASLVETGDTYD